MKFFTPTFIGLLLSMLSIKGQTFSSPIKSPPVMTKLLNYGNTNGKFVVISENAMSGPKFAGLKQLTNDNSISFNKLILKSTVYSEATKKKESFFDLGFPNERVYVLTTYFSKSDFNVVAYTKEGDGIQLKHYQIDATTKKSKWTDRTLYTTAYNSNKWISNSKILIRDNHIIMITPVNETIEVLKVNASSGAEEKKIYDIGFETEIQSLQYEKEAVLGTFKVSDRTYVFSLDSDNTHKTSLLFKGDSLGISYSIKKVNDEIIIAGTYSAFKEGQQGVYFNKRYASTLESKMEKFIPVDTAYVNFLAKQDFRDKKVLKNFYYDYTQFDTDNNIYVFSSQYYKSTSATAIATASNGMGGMGSTQPLYCGADILLVKMDLEGNVSYQSIVPRGVRNHDTDYIGYCPIVTSEKVVILTSDNPENKAIENWKTAAEFPKKVGKETIGKIEIDNQGNAKRVDHYFSSTSIMYNFNYSIDKNGKLEFFGNSGSKFNFFQYQP